MAYHSFSFSRAVRTVAVLATAMVLCTVAFAPAFAERPLSQLLEPGDSVLVQRMDDGRVVLAENPDTLLVPASILKIVTSLAAFEILGKDFRFITEFYTTPGGDLIIKGYGDPSLVSEEIEAAAFRIAAMVPSVGDILVDASFFAPGIAVPGRKIGSSQPYDAVNGALCANYNTVNVTRKDGRYVSAEPQTPLLDFARRRIARMDPFSGRVAFIEDASAAALYAGELFAWFLEKHGCHVSGKVACGRVEKGRDTLEFTHVSSSALGDNVEKLLRYSNNFTANQLLLACGAKAYGPPADLARGVAAVQDYVKTVLAIDGMKVVEGSGLSRENRMSARMMAGVLAAFEPYAGRMRVFGNEYYKTGTLSGVNTRAGYFLYEDGPRYLFVVMSNTPGRSADVLMPEIRKRVESDRRQTPAGPGELTD
ncbi:D-alanyl-D-alanine carboxypeptidase/D-alanyl-D-alanine-endopeptidase [Desulfosudis oleivorans]|uniref:D-alanyl-D-alanine carboxypeptidase/D-alanyl-D-alanine-endopeptidase n=1 Tax=Desulfosudis oleivorans TaxID=181663 RepID=UPI0002D38FFC|nr:D-alanyl-D-alanine carboxypeptidase [Desulfosudis oleivorans]